LTVRGLLTVQGVGTENRLLAYRLTYLGRFWRSSSWRCLRLKVRH